MDNFYLTIYLFLWVITFILHYNKRRYFDAGSFLISIYILGAIFSILAFNDIYYDFNHLTFFPFIYLYFMTLLASYPVLHYNILTIKKIQKPSNLFLNIFIIIFIVSTFISFIKSFPSIGGNIVKILVETSGGMDVYNDIMRDSYDSGDGTISNFFSIISNVSSDLGILFFFYYLTLNNRKKIFTVGLFLSCFFSIFTNIAISQRGPVIQSLLTILIAFFALRRFISYRIIKRIKIVGFIVAVVVVSLIATISISRFKTSSGGSLSSLYYYTGQINLNFNNYGLDNGGIRYGDRTVPFFKRCLGYDNVPKNFWERRMKYPNLKINDEVFIGLVGDFTLDFGPYIPIFLFSFLTSIILIGTKIRNGQLLFHQLILYYLVMCVCIQSAFKLYSFADLGALQLIYFGLAYFAFRVDYESRNRFFSNRSKMVTTKCC